MGWIFVAVAGATLLIFFFGQARHHSEDVEAGPRRTSHALGDRARGRRIMRTTFSVLICAACLAACGGGGSELVVSVYKPFGSGQCSGSGLSLSDLRRQLANAGVQVFSAACGFDGMAHPAVCGAPDGAIGIFEIPASQAQAAAALSFLRLTDLPQAQQVPCT